MEEKFINFNDICDYVDNLSSESYIIKNLCNILYTISMDRLGTDNDEILSLMQVLSNQIEIFRKNYIIFEDFVYQNKVQ